MQKAKKKNTKNTDTSTKKCKTVIMRLKESLDKRGKEREEMMEKRRKFPED